MSPTAAKSPIGQPFVELSAVNSTNIYAMEQLQANIVSHGAAFFAHEQFAGKGQRGKSWHSEPGSNIILSVVLDSSFLLITQQFHLSVMVAVACHDFFSSYAPGETRIKWPNDIYWRDRKAGGILVENQVRGNKWQWAVAGMGLNINQTRFPDQANKPVSLTQIMGRQFHTTTMARELCSHLEKRYQQLKTGRFPNLLACYNEQLFRRGEITRLKKDAISFHCTIEGVDAGGDLLVSGCAQERFCFGEVEWLLQ